MNATMKQGLIGSKTADKRISETMPLREIVIK